MKKTGLIIWLGITLMKGYSQPLFTYGANEVSKDEFTRAFNKNIARPQNKEASLREYLTLYAAFKMKVAAAKELKLDMLDRLQSDVLNFRSQLENDYAIGPEEARAKVNFKKNAAVQDDMLLLYADSIAYSKNYKCPAAGEAFFSVGKAVVKVSDWLKFAKDYKTSKDLYKGESNSELLQKFIDETSLQYFRSHLEDYNADFKYQLQEFKEGSLLYEVMDKKVWGKSTGDSIALKAYYETNKEHFLWNESIEAIFITAKSYAYAEYAFEKIKKGQHWKDITAQSEGMIVGDSSRYEISQLPIPPGAAIKEGAILAIVKNEADNSAGFVKVIKIYPAKAQRSFEEARALVINEYQKQLDERWMKELVKKYPVKVNEIVFQSLLNSISNK